MSNDYRFLAPLLNNVPDSLQELPWAVWIAEPRQGKSGKFNKAPRSPKSGYKIGANKPELFGTFNEAKSAYQNGNYTGVGILLINNGLVGVDIDDYSDTVEKVPAVNAWLKNALELGVYCEKSPSGTGLRLFYVDPSCVRGKKHGRLEIYSDLRFLTFTGHRIRSLEEIV